MTTPVFMSGNTTDATMQFVMPAKMKQQDVPLPTDSAVSVKELQAGRFAVYRYSGGRDAKSEADSLERLV